MLKLILPKINKCFRNMFNCLLTNANKLILIVKFDLFFLFDCQLNTGWFYRTVYSSVVYKQVVDYWLFSLLRQINYNEN